MRLKETMVLLLLASLILRFYPALISGQPFSTDAWPLIKNAEVLLEKTPVRLDEKTFDGYNNYWPASSIFGALLSLVTGLSPVAAMALGIPMAAALAIIPFYILAYNLLKKRMAAFLASMLLATAFPYSLSMAGVIKEAYASPICMLLILIFLALRDWRGIILFALSSFTLSMTHHLTSIATLAILTSITLSACLVRLLRGAEIDWSFIISTLTLAASIALYFAIYAHRGLKVALTLSDLITVVSYQIVAFTFAFYVTHMRRRKSVDAWVSIKCLLAAALPMLTLTLCTIKNITPDAPVLPKKYIIYGAPLIISAPLTLLGFRGLRELENKNNLNSWPLFWLAVILGIETYALFGDPPVGLVLMYRMINFLWPPLTILCGYGAYKLCSEGRRLIIKVLAVVAIISIIALNCYNVYAAIIVGERYMGYFWLYRVQEYRAGAWLSNLHHDKMVAGDVKFAYLLKGYFRLNYDEMQGLLYLSGKSSSKPDILITYDWMEKNGYVVYGGYSIDLPGSWLEKTHVLNLVYSNGVVNIHASS